MLRPNILGDVDESMSPFFCLFYDLIQFLLVGALYNKAVTALRFCEL